MEDHFSAMAEDYQCEATRDLRNALHRWAEKKQSKAFLEAMMKQRSYFSKELHALSSPFNNGRKGQMYNVQFVLPSYLKEPCFRGWEETGLQCIQNESGDFIVSGIPLKEGDVCITLECAYEGWVEGLPRLLREFHIIINPDPKDLWRDLPVPADLEYPKSNEEAEYIQAQNSKGELGKRMLAASRRGRSHAHEGKPRDDHFCIRHCPESGWYIMAVADGAGSASFSREGSRIACETIVGYCEGYLKEVNNTVDDLIQKKCDKVKPILAEFKDLKNNNSDVDVTQKKDLERIAKATYPEIKDFVKSCGYNLIKDALHNAYTRILDEAAAQSRPMQLYATTLLLTLCKKFYFPQGKPWWIVISYNVGDGAIALVNKDKELTDLTVLCKPDEGEFGGQTRFLTMKDMITEKDTIMDRIFVQIQQDFTALIMMTDGVSDAKLETSAKLHNPEIWKALWEDINQNVDLSADSESCKERLLEWLNFWSQGNHDDRTIAMVY